MGYIRHSPGCRRRLLRRGDYPAACSVSAHKICIAAHQVMLMDIQTVNLLFFGDPKPDRVFNDLEH